ncbi:MAG: efflux RND transporter periplasmic adaptor subunit [Deltaproteobacteria bacterium]|nr:efflux RND transporter periplasmic adaptor subunit [Deltaproteobacteria bacterium]
MKKFKLILIILLISFSSYAYCEAPPPAKVKIAETFEKIIAETNKIIGIVDFNKRSKVSAELSGLIIKVVAEEGTFVKKGDMLFELNTDFIKKNIEIKQKEKERLQIKINSAAKNLNRYKNLYQNNSASQKDYEKSVYDFGELIKEKEIIEKNIEKFKIELKKSVIRAFFDGIILQKYKNEGEWIDPGTPVMLLGSANDICVKIAVSENLLKYIKAGDEISISVNGKHKELSGKVKKIVPMADLASKTFEVFISMPYLNNLIQNMSASAQIPASEPKKLIMIKRDALIKYNNKDFIYTIKDNKAKMLPVNILTYLGEYAGVDNDNIKPGMPVIIDGNNRLRPDSSVEIIE